MYKINMIFLMLLSFIIVSCGGGTATTGNNNVTSLSGVVTLSGVVANGTSSGGIAVGAVPAGTTTAIKGVYPNALVMAADKNGNVKTATTDKTGKFTLQLNSGTSYGLVFMDLKTQKVLGSLVQANNQAVAGALNLTGTGDLGTIVINPVSGKAVSDKDANGTLANATVANAPAGMDTNGDGKITQADIGSMQATTAIKNPSALTDINLADYFEKPGTWGTQITMWKDVYGTTSAYDLFVASSVRMKGPQGSMVDANKVSDIQYYQSSPSQSGYYGVVNAAGWKYSDYVSLKFTAPPTVYDNQIGPWDWANASYADNKNNQIWSNYDLGNPNSIWEKNVPLNVTLGKVNALNITDPYGTQTNAFTVTMAKNNGQPYVFLDSNKVSHAVILVSNTWTWTPNSMAPSGYAAQSGTDSFYVVRDYGVVTVNAKDAQGNILAPSVALQSTSFGDIISGATGKFIRASNINPLASTPKLTPAQRDLMLAYTWDNRDKIGTLQQATTASTTTTILPEYFSVNYDMYGQSTQPASWDVNSYMPLALQAQTAQLFTTSINYGNNAINSTFTYEFRVYDALGNMSNVGTSGPVTARASNGTYTPLSIPASITVPSLLSLPASAQYTYMDPASNTSITEGWVDLWLVMKDGTGKVLMEQALDSYIIQ